MSHPTHAHTPTAPAASLVCSGLGFSWPDGRTLFQGFDLSIGAGRTGLVGLNGSGKSTLLRLLTRELQPDAGSVNVTGRLGHLPQNLVLDAALPVAEVLG